MLEIFKAMTGIIAIVTIYFTILYFCFSVGLFEIMNIMKANFNKEIMKATALIFDFFYMALIIIFNRISQGIEFNKIHWLFSSYAIFSIVLYNIFIFLTGRKRKTLLLKSEEFKAHPNWSKLLVFLSIITIVASSFITYYEFKDINIYSIYIKTIQSKNLEEGMASQLVIYEFLIISLLNTLVSGSIYTYSKLLDLQRYVIASNKFEHGKVIAYIIAENDKEIIIKPDNSYCIILNRDLIEAYMPAPNSCYLDEHGEINYENDYEGYVICEEKSEINSKIKRK